MTFAPVFSVRFYIPELNPSGRTLSQVCGVGRWPFATVWAAPGHVRS